MKIDIDMVGACAQAVNIDQSKIDDLLYKLQEEQTQKDAEKEKPEKVKKNFLCIVCDPNGDMADIRDYSAWVVQIPEDDDPEEVLSKIHEAAQEFNCTKKGRKHPVKSVVETCECVSSKYFTSKNVWLKTKYPVQIITSDNKIPRQERYE